MNEFYTNNRLEKLYRRGDDKDNKGLQREENSGANPIEQV
jgi:hypothetical protein